LKGLNKECKIYFALRKVDVIVLNEWVPLHDEELLQPGKHANPEVKPLPFLVLLPF